LSYSSSSSIILSNEVQDLFEYVEHKISNSSSNAIDEKDLPLKIPARNQSAGLYQDRYHLDTTIGEARIVEKKMPEYLTSLSSEFLIKNESDINTLTLLLQQKFQMSKEKLEQWRTKIAFELRDNHNYWKKECESMSEADFLEYKRNYEAKLSIPTTPHKKELKKKSLAIIEYA